MAACILIVEDNPTNLELMTYLLTAYGHRVVTAADGEEGVTAAAEHGPDLIVCDVHMPRLDGYGVARRLKADPELARIPLLAVSALAMVGDREKILATGFDGYIAKPIEPEAFVAEVETFLHPTQHAGPLPADDGAAPEPPPCTVLPQRQGTVLLVDDSLSNRSFIESTLVPFGYGVVTVGSVQDALERMKTWLPDLVLSDIHMPGESGFDFLAAMQADERLKDIPFAFISSSMTRDSERAIRRALAEHVKFIERPIEPQRLLAEVNDSLTKKGG